MHHLSRIFLLLLHIHRTGQYEGVLELPRLLLRDAFSNSRGSVKVILLYFTYLMHGFECECSTATKLDDLYGDLIVHIDVDFLEI